MKERALVKGCAKGVANERPGGLPRLDHHLNPHYSQYKVALGRVSSLQDDMADFAQSTSVIDSLRGILNQYPLGVGFFRELLQNSDDAGATKQVRDFCPRHRFVSNCRPVDFCA